MRAALEASRADLVCLQEIGVAVGSIGNATQYEVLADTIWRQHAYGRNAVVAGGHHGNALLSRYPITRWQNVDVSVGRAERRGLLHCVVDAPLGRLPLHVACVHLSLRESERQEQVGQLLAYISTNVPSDAPLVLAGDFNDWRGLAHARLCQEGALEEIHAAATGRPARTFPARFPLLPLDRIYVRQLRHEPLPLPRRPWARLSDHAPLGGIIGPEAPRAIRCPSPSTG